MYAIFQRDGAHLSHAWRVLEAAEQDGADVVIDGHRIEGAELVRVETDREYLGADVVEARERRRNPGLVGRVAQVLGRGV